MPEPDMAAVEKAVTTLVDGAILHGQGKLINLYVGRDEQTLLTLIRSIIAERDSAREERDKWVDDYYQLQAERDRLKAEMDKAQENAAFEYIKLKAENERLRTPRVVERVPFVIEDEP